MWYGLEAILEAMILLGTSIAVGRYLGLAKLGYFSYINFFVTIVTRTSGTGLSTATRKYMSEFIALDRMGTARAVYNLAHRYQLIASVSISSAGLVGILLFGDPAYRLMSSILIISIVPGLMSWVPAQANQAFEDVSKNTLSAFGYMGVYGAVIGLTIYFKWGLVGIASASLLGRTAEVFMRTIPLNAKLRKLPLDALDSTIVLRIRRFCIQAVGIQLLMSVVWDRSEMVFLRAFSSLEQMGAYSISFTFVNNLATIPRIFGSANGITLMVEASRDAKRVAGLVQNASRYLLLIALPVNLGAAAIAYPAIRLAYGTRYLVAVPVLMVAAVLGIPRAFQSIPEILIRTGDRQNRLLLWYSVAGVVNIGLDWILIRRYGAVGAAWGNGIAQSFGIVAIWLQAQQFYKYHLPMKSLFRITLASVPMAAVAYYVGRVTSGFLGLAVTILSAAVVYFLLIKLFHGLEASDRERLTPVGNRLPGGARRIFLALLEFVTPEPA